MKIVSRMDPSLLEYSDTYIIVISISSFAYFLKDISRSAFLLFKLRDVKPEVFICHNRARVYDKYFGTLIFSPFRNTDRARETCRPLRRSCGTVRFVKSHSRSLVFSRCVPPRMELIFIVTHAAPSLVPYEIRRWARLIGVPASRLTDFRDYAFKLAARRKRREKERDREKGGSRSIFLSLPL